MSFNLYMESWGGWAFFNSEALIDYLILIFPLLLMPPSPLASWAMPNFFTAGDAISS